ncbi:hypothetical protein [Crossiella cryophila]|uniref:CopG family transcriptional regulator n=1 Tax=Crossiella cryophila TaxID=43355 RepID=A0A7W7CFZ8_9PSEU|nr:hypothetical protein [Crossiella cryophila]MBB4680531.1 hypothetical protein [Crossiella cryophila]
MSTGAHNLTKITIYINPATEDALQAVMEREGITLTEAVRHLVAYGDVVYRADRVEGKMVLISDGDQTERITLL